MQTAFEMYQVYIKPASTVKTKCKNKTKQIKKVTHGNASSWIPVIFLYAHLHFST